ncbi:MAG: hypothetical protein VZR09_01685 [Candidatus Gastranaerophilaceae bacterium]|nr:hypothetical protein [Candidatus Gastranaerophilaceae bacterium]
MISPITVSKIFSTLGNNNSLVPMGIKDTANSLGLTAGSYITGQSAESHDRFIDEFGTQAIWLLGIPAYKKVLDWTMFKPLGYDAGVDVRVMKDPEVFELAKKYAKKHDDKYKNNKNVKQIAESLEKAAKNPKYFKGLTFGKFVASTLLTIISYGALTKFRHDYRENKIKKEFYEKQAKIKSEEQSSGSKNQNQTKVNKGQTSFTGIQDVMFSPVKNMMLVDAAITGERLGESKNSQEFMQYVIKEGFFWFFMYFAGAQIKNFLEKHSLTKKNLPIDLDSRVVESEELKDALLNNKIMKHVNEFPLENKPSNADVYRFVNDNPDNLVVKMAKKSDIIETVKEKTGLFSKAKDTGSVDNRKYINTDDVVGVKNKLKMLYDKGQEFVQKEADRLGLKVEELSETDRTKMLETYLKKVQKANRWATIKNIGACIGVLGLIMPGVIVAWRLLDKDNQGYRVREDIENKLKQEIASKI